GRSSSADPNFAGASPRATTSRSRLYTVRKLRSVNLVNGSTICATTPWSRASIASARSGIFAISCAMLSACWNLSRKPLRTASILCAISARFRQSKSLYVLMKMKTDDGDQQHRASDHREQQLETKRRPERPYPARPTQACQGPHAEARHSRFLNSML